MVANDGGLLNSSGKSIAASTDNRHPTAHLRTRTALRQSAGILRGVARPGRTFPFRLHESSCLRHQYRDPVHRRAVRRPRVRAQRAGRGPGLGHPHHRRAQPAGRGRARTGPARRPGLWSGAGLLHRPARPRRLPGQLPLVFGRGPGSFTGLRTACAVAQGLAWGANAGRGIPVLPIDTLAAVAEQARFAHGCSNVVAVLDARMDEVYMAHYQWQSGTWQNSGAPALSAPEDVQVPPGWTVAGNAQAAYGERLAPDSHHVHALPTATALLRLGARADLRWPGRTGGRCPAALHSRQSGANHGRARGCPIGTGDTCLAHERIAPAPRRAPRAL